MKNLEFDTPPIPPCPNFDGARPIEHAQSDHPTHKALVNSASDAAYRLTGNTGLSLDTERIGNEHGFALARIYVARRLISPNDSLGQSAIMEYLRLRAAWDVGRLVTHLPDDYKELIEHADEWRASAIPSTKDRP